MAVSSATTSPIVLTRVRRVTAAIGRPSLGYRQHCGLSEKALAFLRSQETEQTFRSRTRFLRIHQVERLLVGIGAVLEVLQGRLDAVDRDQPEMRFSVMI